MFKWFLVALAGYVIYRMFKNDIKAKLEGREPDEPRRRKAEDMTRDPICGTFVDMAEAITVRNDDKRYYFCGYECRDAFLKRLQNGESPESIMAEANFVSSKNAAAAKDDPAPPPANKSF